MKAQRFRIRTGSAKCLLMATSALTLALAPSIASAQTAATEPEGEPTVTSQGPQTTTSDSEIASPASDATRYKPPSDPMS